MSYAYAASNGGFSDGVGLSRWRAQTRIGDPSASLLSRTEVVVAQHRAQGAGVDTPPSVGGRLTTLNTGPGATTPQQQTMQRPRQQQQDIASPAPPLGGASPGSPATGPAKGNPLVPGDEQTLTPTQAQKLALSHATGAQPFRSPLENAAIPVQELNTLPDLRRRIASAAQTYAMSVSIGMPHIELALPGADSVAQWLKNLPQSPRVLLDKAVTDSFRLLVSHDQVRLFPKFQVFPALALDPQNEVLVNTMLDKVSGRMQQLATLIEQTCAQVATNGAPWPSVPGSSLKNAKCQRKFEPTFEVRIVQDVAVERVERLLEFISKSTAGATGTFASDPKFSRALKTILVNRDELCTVVEATNPAGKHKEQMATARKEQQQQKRTPPKVPARPTPTLADVPPDAPEKAGNAQGVVVKPEQQQQQQQPKKEQRAPAQAAAKDKPAKKEVDKSKPSSTLGAEPTPGAPSPLPQDIVTLAAASGMCQDHALLGLMAFMATVVHLGNTAVDKDSPLPVQAKATKEQRKDPNHLLPFLYHVPLHQLYTAIKQKQATTSGADFAKLVVTLARVRFNTEGQLYSEAPGTPDALITPPEVKQAIKANSPVLNHASLIERGLSISAWCSAVFGGQGDPLYDMVTALNTEGEWRSHVQEEWNEAAGGGLPSGIGKVKVVGDGAHLFSFEMRMALTKRPPEEWPALLREVARMVRHVSQDP